MRQLESRRRPTEGGAGLNFEGAGDAQRVGSFAERTDRFAGKETGKALQNCTICVASKYLEARVRNRGGSGQPPEPAAGRRPTELCGEAPASTCPAARPSRPPMDGGARSPRVCECARVGDERSRQS